jgi:hypothetical protein
MLSEAYFFIRKVIAYGKLPLQTALSFGYFMKSGFVLPEQFLFHVYYPSNQKRNV